MKKQNEQYQIDSHDPVYKSLPCKFTQDELISMKNNLALLVEHMLEEEAEKSESSKNHAAVLKSIKVTIKEISKKISDGFESRPVDCYKKLDFTRGMAYIIRSDINEIVEERPLDENERQLQLGFLDKKADELIEKQG